MKRLFEWFDHTPPMAIAAISVPVAIVWIFAPIACGGNAENVARETLATTARVTEAIDQRTAETMQATRQADLDASETREAFNGRRAPYWRAEESITALRSLLFAAEATLNAVGADGFDTIAPCIAAALVHLKTAIENIPGTPIELPAEVNAAEALLEGFGRQCSDG